MEHKIRLRYEEESRNVLPGWRSRIFLSPNLEEDTDCQLKIANYVKGWIKNDYRLRSKVMFPLLQKVSCNEENEVTFKLNQYDIIGY